MQNTVMEIVNVKEALSFVSIWGGIKWSFVLNAAHPLRRKPIAVYAAMPLVTNGMKGKKKPPHLSYKQKENER